MIERLDHLVLTVADIGRTCDFYLRVLGMVEVTFEGDKKALRFGNQKINLHQAGRELEPKALRPTPGSGDLCFVADRPLPEVIDHLARCGVEVVEGPVRRTGVLGAMDSVYFRDPDGNLIELSTYL